MKLENKVAMVTGGGSGIGEATAKLFAKEGASVAVVDLVSDNASRVAKEIEDAGGKAKAFTADVTNREQIGSIVGEITSQFGGLDILVNNAGINKDAMFMKMREDQWDAVINVNLKGTFLCAQAAAKPMVEKGGGRIINTASIGMLGNPGQANYSASKAGVSAMTKTLALELARNKINVNCVAPGATKTPMTEGIPPEIAEKFVKMIPQRRFADPEEIARVHLFLASDDSSFITGQTIFVDGGMSVGI